MNLGSKEILVIASKLFSKSPVITVPRPLSLQPSKNREIELSAPLANSKPEIFPPRGTSSFHLASSGLSSTSDIFSSNTDTSSSNYTRDAPAAPLINFCLRSTVVTRMLCFDMCHIRLLPAIPCNLCPNSLSGRRRSKCPVSFTSMCLYSFQTPRNFWRFFRCKHSPQRTGC